MKWTDYGKKIIERKANFIVASNIIELFLTLENIEKKEVFFKWDLIKSDRDDNKFVDCAIAGNVDFIVSNDRHFSILKKTTFPLINVITINEFINILKNEQ